MIHPTRLIPPVRVGPAPLRRSPKERDAAFNLVAVDRRRSNEDETIESRGRLEAGKSPRVPGRGWITGRSLALTALALLTLTIDVGLLGCKLCGDHRWNLFGRKRAAVVGALIEPGPPMVIDQSGPGTVVTPGSRCGDRWRRRGQPDVGPSNSKKRLRLVRRRKRASSGGSNGASNSNKDHALNTRSVALTPSAPPPRKCCPPLHNRGDFRVNEPPTGPARRNDIAAADALLNDLPAPATEIGDISPPPSPEADRSPAAATNRNTSPIQIPPILVRPAPPRRLPWRHPPIRRRSAARPGSSDSRPST